MVFRLPGFPAVGRALAVLPDSIRPERDELQVALQARSAGLLLC